MMEGSSTPSVYVRLKKEKQALHDIKPGELNQPVEIPQLTVRTCIECGQPLPESYEPPADEEWTTGIFNCLEDTDSCRTGLFCPCLLFGQNVEAVRDDITKNDACFCHALCVEGGMVIAGATFLLNGIDPTTSFLICETFVFSWWLCSIYNGLFRQEVQRKYHLKDSPCDPCMVHCCLHWCAVCQEHREMKNHLSSNSDAQMTIVKPPTVQEMNSNSNSNDQKHDQTATSSPKNGEHANLEIQSA